MPTENWPRRNYPEIPESSNRGKTRVSREIEFYNLDAIISVGYRVNSAQATQFRIWATQTLREFVIKGFVLDDERLKLNKRFGKDYFDELLERSARFGPASGVSSQNHRHLRAMQHRLRQGRRNHDVLQNRAEQAPLGRDRQDAAEIIAERADAEAIDGIDHLEECEGKDSESDVSIAKNYLIEQEIKELERIVTMYSTMRKSAARQIPMRMADWVRADAF